MSLISVSSASSAELETVEAKRRCSSVEVAVEQQLRHADHAVHRRADLVAHVGQELRLRPVRGLGLVAGALEFGLAAFELQLLALERGDVSAHVHDVAARQPRQQQLLPLPGALVVDRVRLAGLDAAATALGEGIRPRRPIRLGHALGRRHLERELAFAHAGAQPLAPLVVVPARGAVVLHDPAVGIDDDEGGLDRVQRRALEVEAVEQLLEVVRPAAPRRRTPRAC